MFDERIQICGPDNLRFQGLIWQGLLLALGFKNTDKLLVHGTILDKRGRKMSKTEKNGIDPVEQKDKYGAEAVRYYLAAGLSSWSDSCYSEEQLINTCNADLADNFGNLVNRIATLREKFELLDSHFRSSDYLEDEVALALKYLDEYKINEAAQTISAALKTANKYINDEHPWSALKPCESTDEEVLHEARQKKIQAEMVLIEIRGFLFKVAEFYSYFVPETAQRAKDLLLGKKGPVPFLRIEKPKV